MRSECSGGCGVPILAMIFLVKALLCSKSFQRGVMGGGEVGKIKAEMVL